MISVFNAHTSILGDVNTITVDFLCLADSINRLKKENPDKWLDIVKEFKRLSNDQNDEYVHKLMKEFITNLQDLY